MRQHRVAGTSTGLQAPAQGCRHLAAGDVDVEALRRPQYGAIVLGESTTHAHLEGLRRTEAMHICDTHEPDETHGAARVTRDTILTTSYYLLGQLVSTVTRAWPSSSPTLVTLSAPNTWKLSFHGSSGKGMRLGGSKGLRDRWL